MGLIFRIQTPTQQTSQELVFESQRRLLEKPSHMTSWVFSERSVSAFRTFSTFCFSSTVTCIPVSLTRPAAEAGAVCLPVPGVGHGSQGLFQALPTLYVQQHILFVTLKGNSFSQVVPL